MTRGFFDWHPEMNIFAKNIKDRMVIAQKYGDGFVPPPQDRVGFIDVSDVAKYLLKNTHTDLDKVQVKPPWGVTWLEYDTVPVSDGEIFKLVSVKEAYIGTYVLTYDIDEEERSSVLADDGGMMRAVAHDAIAREAYKISIGSLEHKKRMRLMKMLSQKHECHNVLVFRIYLANRRMWGQLGYLAMYLDDRGYPIPQSSTSMLQHDNGIVNHDHLAYYTAPMILGLGLLNCKNVETKIATNSKTQKKKYKRAGSPEIKRRTLVIKTTGAQYDSSGNKTGQKMPWHMCRGHFKTFTDEAPLFGRITGTYWWNAQVRGKKTRGEVHKDYLIEAEE